MKFDHRTVLSIDGQGCSLAAQAETQTSAAIPKRFPYQTQLALTPASMGIIGRSVDPNMKQDETGQQLSTGHYNL